MRRSDIGFGCTALRLAVGLTFGQKADEPGQTVKLFGLAGDLVGKAIHSMDQMRNALFQGLIGHRLTPPLAQFLPKG